MTDLPLLEATNLTKIFPVGGFLKRRFIHAVESFSLDISGKNATITTLAGESGSGKTTIASMLLGLMKPTSGEIKYKGCNIYTMSKNKWKTYRREVQAVFQDPYSVYNPVYKIDRALHIPIKKFKLTSSKKETDDLVLKSFESVGLRPEDLLGRYPHQLSGGERQRIMLARLLCLKPTIIIVDEPISMIDVSLRAMFLNSLLEFRDQHNMSCIFITHNLTNATYLGGDLIILCRGRVVEKGDMRLVLGNPLHPYSKLLVSSVPNPDPKKRWKYKMSEKVTTVSEDLLVGQQCIYYERCPVVTQKCKKEPLQLIEVSKNHQVACHSCT